MFRSLVILALALGANAGRSYNPSVSVKVTDTKLTGLGSLNLVGNIETDLSDSLTVGAEYDYNECENTPREVFARWRGGAGDGQLSATGRLDLGKKSGLGELSWTRGDTRVNAKLDTAHSKVVEEVELSHRVNVQGRGLTLSPKFVSADMVGSLRARLELNDVTHVELEGEQNQNSGDQAFALRVSHEVNENNRVAPEIDLKSGKMKYEWHRKLGGGNSLKTTVQPNENVELEWNDEGARGAWTTKVNVPWKNVDNSDVSFARKFNF